MTPDKTLEELVPCPCCDAPAELDRMRGFRALHDGHIGNAVAIYCTKCGLEISLCHEDYPEYDIEGLVKTLVGLWNVRVIPKPAYATLQSATAAQQQEVERLSEQLRTERERAARWRVLFMELGTHSPSCRDFNNCDCGYAAAVKACNAERAPSHSGKEGV